MQTRPLSISQIVFLLPMHVASEQKRHFYSSTQNASNVCAYKILLSVELCAKSVIYSTTFMFIDFCD